MRWPNIWLGDEVCLHCWIISSLLLVLILYVLSHKKWLLFSIKIKIGLNQLHLKSESHCLLASMYFEHCLYHKSRNNEIILSWCRVQASSQQLWGFLTPDAVNWECNLKFCVWKVHCGPLEMGGVAEKLHSQVTMEATIFMQEPCVASAAGLLARPAWNGAHE